MSARILIIDDEANIRTMMRLALEHVGYTVDTAGDGDEGLKKFGNGADYDLVLLDHRMPGMSGIDVQEKLYKQNPDTRVVMVTAFGTISLALDAIQAGAADFLRKPFTAETLRTAVKSALEKPVTRMTAVPVGLVCKEFTRTTINGFSFNLDEGHMSEDSHDAVCVFDVSRGNDDPTKVTVVVPVYVEELVKAYTDTERLPGEERFWFAMAEEALANYLWQNAEVPAQNKLTIDDLTVSLQRWLDGVLTVQLTEQHAGK